MNISISRDMRKRKSHEVAGILSIKTTVVMLIAVAVGMLIYFNLDDYLGEYNIHVSCLATGLIITFFEATVMGLPVSVFCRLAIREFSTSANLTWESMFMATEDIVKECYPDADITPFIEDKPASKNKKEKNKSTRVKHG